MHDLDLDLGSGHKVYHRLSLIDLYTYILNFFRIGKTFFVDGRLNGWWTDIETDPFIRSTRRS